MLSKCQASWRFYAEVFKSDCESGLVPVGGVQTLPNGYVAEFDGSRVRVVANHSGDCGLYETEIQSWEVTPDAD